MKFCHHADKIYEKREIGEKDKMNNKYNSDLFIIGFLMNLLKKFPLLLIAAVLAIIGIKNKICCYFALGIFILALIWSLIQQILIKHTVEHSDNPDFEPFAKAMMSDNWREETKNIFEEKIRESKEENNEK